MQQRLQHSFVSSFYNIVFYQDLGIGPAEAESLISQIVTALHKIRDVLVLNFTFDG